MPRRSRSNVALETDLEVSKRSAGDHRPRRKIMATDLLNCDRGIIEMIVGFVSTQAYLSVASVSTKWRNAWGQQPTVTSRRWPVQSRSCLDWARVCGLEIWDDPCLFAAAEGRLDVLQHAVALSYSREGMPICEWAAGGGHLEVVKWGRANGYPWGWSSIRAAEGGHLEVLKWCVTNGCPVKIELRSFQNVTPRGHYRGKQIYREQQAFDVMSAAAWGGHLDILMWCRDQGYPLCPEASEMAAAGGHLDVLVWLRANGYTFSLETTRPAAGAGNLEILEWCKANGCPWDDFAILDAAEGGNLKVVKWCVAFVPHRNFHVAALARAASRGHLEVVQWMRANGCPWGDDVCYKTACGGHLEVLKWCLMNGCSWGRYRSNGSPEFNGSVSLMTWAASNGCPWMSVKPEFDSICVHAANAGNLDVLQWCVEHQPLPIYDVLRGAASSGQVHILEWVRTRMDGKWWRWVEGGSLCKEAARSGSLETVKWFRANKVRWGALTIEVAMASGNLELLHWCRANGCPWGTNTFKMNIRWSNIELLAWCHSNGCPLDARLILQHFGHMNDEIIEWCRDHLPRERGEHWQEPL